MRFLADENFNNEILRGVRRRVPTAEITRVQDTEMMGEPDPLVLEWAVQHGYIVLTHDVNTMRGYFYERVAANLPVPGVFLVHKTESIGQVIDSLELILLASDESEWAGEIRYLPLG
jgi:rRNA-processing protein FCF1